MNETPEPKAPPETVILMAAVCDELTPTIEQLRLTESDGDHIGQVDDRKIIASVSGLGKDRAVAALTKLIEAHQPQRIIHLGFAGGMDPTLAAGDLLNIRYVRNESGKIIRLGESVPEFEESDSDPPSLKTLLTRDTVADSPKLKKQLFTQYKASAVDMETFYTASLAMDQGIPFMALRAISDPHDMALPAEAINWIKPDGTPDMAKVMGFIATHPWLTPTLMKLQSHASKAPAKIADAVESVLAK